MSDVSVLIVGGGTVGLATAVFLGHHGVRSIVVERRSAPSNHPRALGISPRSLELFREVGLRAELDAVAVRSALPWRAEARTVADVGAPPERISAAGWHGDDISPEISRGHYPQHRIDSVLIPAARRCGATVEFGVALDHLELDEEAARATLSDGRIIRADYVIGADGVHSTVRSQLGVTVSGPGEIGGTNMNILFAADLVGRFGAMPVMTQIEHPEVNGIMLGVGEGEWVLHVPIENGTTLSPEQCVRAVRTAIGDPVPVEVLNAVPWRATARMADEFRCGRAFLVGDAARAISPLGAFGLNTGLADAHNVAWKLAMVIAGRAGDALLDTYHDERHSVAGTVTEQALLRLENPRLHWDPNAAAERVAAGLYNAPVVTMALRYASTAIVAPVPELPSTEDLVAALDGAPGSHLAHRWVERGVSTQDLNRSHFAILTGPDGHGWCDALQTLPVARSSDIRGVTLDAATAAAIGVAPAGAILVRPDNYIAWRTQGPADAERLADIIATVTAIPVSSPVG